jgi:1-acyl-sn-glycerol-3-phosphate acyltransferase
MLTVVRLTRVVIHLLIGFDAALAFGRLPEKAQRAFLRWWARGLLAALGVRVTVQGQAALHSPAFIVANHVSWLDVIALAATQPAVFVCKSEIAAWPGIGWLLKRIGTVFIRRGSFRDVWRVNMQLRARFAELKNVAVFPEGTTSMGDDVLVFRPALFQPAVDRGVPIQPVAIAYSSQAAAYVGETSFLQSLLAICAARSLEMHVALLPPLASGLTRRQAATQARSVIRERLAQSSKTRSPCAADAAFASTSRAKPGSASQPSPLGRQGT